MFSGEGESAYAPLRLEGSGIYARRSRLNQPFRRVRALVAVVECTGVPCPGVLLIPKIRLILVIKGTWVFPDPTKSQIEHATYR